MVFEWLGPQTSEIRTCSDSDPSLYSFITFYYFSLFFVLAMPFKCRFGYLHNDNVPFVQCLLYTYYSQRAKLHMNKLKCSSKCGLGELKYVPWGCKIWRKGNPRKWSEKITALLKFLLYFTGQFNTEDYGTFTDVI